MANLKSFNGIALASLKSFGPLLKARIKTLTGLDAGGTPFSPSEVSNMIYWFKADGLVLTNGDLITSMTDFSGNGYHADEGTDPTKPTYVTNVQNGLPVARFAGSQGRQFGLNPSVEESVFDLATYSIFFVAKKASGSGSTIIAKTTTSSGGVDRRKLQVQIASSLSLNAGADGTSISQAMTTTNFNVGAVIGRGNSDHDLIVNGVVSNKTTAMNDSTFNNARVEIGQAFANGAERLIGDIGEIIVYSGDVGATARAAIIQHLGTKWGIAVS